MTSQSELYRKLKRRAKKLGKSVIPWTNRGKGLTRLKNELRKLKKIENETPLYAVSIKFDWKNPKFTNVHKGKTTTFLTRNPKKSIIMQKAREAGTDYAHQRTNPMYSINVSNIRVQSVRKVENIRNLRSLPVFGSKLCYPKLGLKSDKFTGKCGYDVLLKNYPKQAKSLNSLESFFNKDYSKGLNAYDFNKFCKKYDISLYLSDLDCNLIYKYTSKNQNYKALILIIANNHCYEITSKQRRLRVIRNAIGSLKRWRVEKNQPLKKYKYLPGDVDLSNLQMKPNINYCVGRENLTELYYEMLENNIVHPSKWVQDDVVAIYMGDYSIYSNPDYKICKKIAMDLEIPYSNQTIPALSRQYFESLNLTWYYSTPNRVVQKYLSMDAFKASAFNITFDTAIPEKYKVLGVDQTKQYTYIAKLGDIPYFTLNDCVKKEFRHSFPPGFYYVETTQHFPFNGNGFYDYKLVREGISMDLIKMEDVLFYISYNTSFLMDKSLCTFIDKCYKKTTYAKHLCNSLIGSFNIKKIKENSKTFIVDNWLEACYYTLLYPDHSRISTITLGKKELYRIHTYEEFDKIENNFPIRTAIVQRANLETYKMYRKVISLKLIPLQVKTDCIYYAYNPKKGKFKTVKNPKHGEWREDKNIPDKFKPHRNEPRTNKVAFSLVKWNNVNPKHIADENEYYDYRNILEYDRVYIQGFAGSGKSHMIKKLKAELPNFKVISFTHIASNNVGGLTSHSFFGIDENGKSQEKLIIAISKKYEGLIIDEINQIPSIVYKILVKLPQSFKIYGFGDFRQEEAIEHNCYPIGENEQTFIDLFDCNIIRLKKQCRSDKEFANACIKYHDTEEFRCVEPFINIYKEIVLPQQKFVPNIMEYLVEICRNRKLFKELNITRTNRMRKFINYIMMKINAPKKSEIIKCNSDYGQDMYLYRGLPVLSLITQKKIELYNNEMFVIDDFNDGDITLKTRKVCKDTKIRTHIISKKFFKKHFCPAYGLTTYKVEGLTIDIPYMICQFELMGIKSRYTALTRARDPKLITVSLTPQLEKEIAFLSYKVDGEIIEEKFNLLDDERHIASSIIKFSL